MPTLSILLFSVIGPGLARHIFPKQLGTIQSTDDPCKVLLLVTKILFQQALLPLDNSSKHMICPLVHGTSLSTKALEVLTRCFFCHVVQLEDSVNNYVRCQHPETFQIFFVRKFPRTASRYHVCVKRTVFTQLNPCSPLFNCTWYGKPPINVFQLCTSDIQHRYRCSSSTSCTCLEDNL